MTAETAVTAPEISDADARRGFLFALSCYLLWGGLPFYMKAVAHIPAAEVVAHRILWSVPIAGVLLLLMGRTADIRKALRTPRTLAMGALTATLITINWGTYVWAIATDRALETALGYYINPLLSVLLGAVVLGEKLSRAQIGAILLAVVAVAAADAGDGRAALGVAGARRILGCVRPVQEDLADRSGARLLPRSADPVRSGARLHRLAAGPRCRPFRRHRRC